MRDEMQTMDPPRFRAQLFRAAIPLILMSIPVLACAGPVADSVYRNGRVYTVNEGQPWATAIASAGGRIIYVGDDAGAASYIGAKTKVEDLDGRLVLPGIHDAHTHLLWGSLAAKYQCKFPGGPFGDAHIAALRDCERSLKPGEWLIAGMFSTSQFPGAKPDRKYLDAAFPDRPVYLHESTAHNGLANSKALEIAGIDADTPDPVAGKFVRDPDGRITGELIETATAPLRKHFPRPTADQKRQALLWALQMYNRWGVTSVQDASGEIDLLETLQQLEREKLLTLDVEAHLMWGSKTFLVASDAETEALISDRSKYRSQHVDVDNIKMWIDGTPTPPYFTEAGVDPVSHAPDLEHVLIPVADLTAAVRRFDAAGMRVKMHVAGAGAAHVALDAIEAARHANPNGTRRHELAHTNLVLEEDMDRMRALNVTGEMSPAVWQLYGHFLGNPPQKAWQFRTLAKKGVLMTIGSDWPVLAEPNLFPALQGILEFGDESIDLPSALRMYTINGALASGKQAEKGSIERGKRANFIVLDRNILEVPPTGIGQTTVVLTVFDGNVVYRSGEKSAGGRAVAR